MVNRLKAFYASPFSEEFRWVRDAVATACREHEVELRAVDEIVIPGGNIVHAIHQEIDDCDFAFAVLTDSNPNVFYELGRLLQASKPTVLLISEKQ
jgi:nucleoside 2-deoxyribosyltransferase